MSAFYRWMFWRLCSLRNRLDVAIRYCRVKGGYQVKAAVEVSDADGEHGSAA